MSKANRYKPDPWIMFNTKTRSKKQISHSKIPKGIFLRLPVEKQQSLRILKTRMNCDTWEEWVDNILELIDEHG